MSRGALTPHTMDLPDFSLLLSCNMFKIIAVLRKKSINAFFYSQKYACKKVFSYIYAINNHILEIHFTKTVHDRYPYDLEEYLSLTAPSSLCN